MATLLEQVKADLQTTTQNEIYINDMKSKIMAGINDLIYTAGIDVGGITSWNINITDNTDGQDILVANAVKTYVRWTFGDPEKSLEYKASYESQKAMLQTAFPIIEDV